MNEINDFKSNIGKKVMKQPVSEKNQNKHVSKPFKSGFKTNTIKDVIEHPILKIPAYTFFEDDSYVECRRCKIIENN